MSTCMQWTVFNTSFYGEKCFHLSVLIYSNVHITFNLGKCHLVIFAPQRPPSNISVKFGPGQLKQVESVTHVGIDLHQSLKNSSAVEARIQKGRASLFSILSIEKDYGFISPSVLSSIIDKVCFPTVLYGAELWHSMTLSDMDKLERFTRLAAKSIQKFPMRTRTDIALGMLGWLPMRARVEQRKLTFLQKLCTMPPETLARQIFDLRLNLFILRGYENQIGFIPDIWEIVTRYQLQDYITLYIRSSEFPSKQQWKNLIARKIRQSYEAEWSHRLQIDTEFSRFKVLQPRLEMSVIWTLSLDTSTVPEAFLVARLWSKVTQGFPNTINCALCHAETNDIYKHIVSSCPSFGQQRLDFINCISQTVSAEIGTFLQYTNIELFYCTVLGSTTHNFPDLCKETLNAFLKLSFNFVRNTLRQYGLKA